jgi:hypothetical protein
LHSIYSEHNSDVCPNDLTLKGCTEAEQAQTKNKKIEAVEAQKLFSGRPGIIDAP